MGMLSAARGLTMLTTNGNPVSQLNSDFRWLGNGYVGGVPVPVIIFIVLFALAWLVLNKTLFRALHLRRRRQPEERAHLGD